MRKLAAAAVVVLVAVLAYVWLAPTVIPAVAAPRIEAGGSGPRKPAAEPLRAVGPTAARPGAAPAPVAKAAPSVADLQARDKRRKDALAPFQAALLGSLDSCLTPTPGPRTPQRLVLHFERAPSAPAGPEQFTLVGVDPADTIAGQASPRESPSWRCFSAQIGKPLVVAAGPAQQEARFSEVVAIPLPMSVGWAAPPQPGFRIR